MFPARQFTDRLNGKGKPPVAFPEADFLPARFQGQISLFNDGGWFLASLCRLAGLTFGTIITMVLVPTLYATLYKIPSPRPSSAGRMAGQVNETSG